MVPQLQMIQSLKPVLKNQASTQVQIQEWWKFWNKMSLWWDFQILLYWDSSPKKHFWTCLIIIYFRIKLYFTLRELRFAMKVTELSLEELLKVEQQKGVDNFFQVPHPHNHSKSKYQYSIYPLRVKREESYIVHNNKILPWARIGGETICHLYFLPQF